MLNRILTLSLVSALVSTPIVLAQTEKKSFGVFHALCNTDRMTDVRSCQVLIQPEPQLDQLEQSRRDFFIVFIDPATSSISGMGATRLRVDKNRALSGRCFEDASACVFNDKKDNERLLKELETGTSVLVEVRGRVFEFDLADYKKALAAYREMKKAPAPGAAHSLRFQ